MNFKYVIAVKIIKVHLDSCRIFTISRNNLPAEVGDDIELKAVQLQFPSARTLDKNTSLYKVLLWSKKSLILFV